MPEWWCCSRNGRLGQPMGPAAKRAGHSRGVWVAFLALVVLAHQFEHWRRETEERKRDARRKIIVGAAALPMRTSIPAFGRRCALPCERRHARYRQRRNPRSAWKVIGVRVATEQFYRAGSCLPPLRTAHPISPSCSPPMIAGTACRGRSRACCRSRAARFELIIVDDASRDDTLAYLATLADPRYPGPGQRPQPRPQRGAQPRPRGGARRIRGISRFRRRLPARPPRRPARRIRRGSRPRRHLELGGQSMIAAAPAMP